jgi:hypothetical protein
VRHRTILSLALVLGMVPVLNSTPLLAMQDAQQQATQQAEGCQRVRKVTVGDETFEFKLDCTDTATFSEGLEVAALTGNRPADAEQLYAVRFIGEAGASGVGTAQAGTPESGNEAGAYIPESFNSQAMVVEVLAGQFAFRTQGPGVIVAPQDQYLEKYTATASIALGGDPNARKTGEPAIREFTDGGFFPCVLNPHGNALCELLPGEFDDELTFARLDPGDTVYLPDNSTCFLCNSEQIGSTPAEVLIWTPTTGLGEIGGELESIANSMATTSPGTPTTQGSGRIVGWMFNPGGSCK